MSKVNDLTGRTFGRLKVLKRDKQDKYYNIFWLCECQCGVKSNTGFRFKSGATQSCGCLNRELSGKRIGNLSRTHGYANKERLYEIWKNMKYRCYNENDNRFKHYGGKGVKVCNEWKDDYLSFRNWSMTSGYNDNLSIDRINNDGDYKPSNCRWVDNKTQANNQSRNRILTYKGKSKTMSEWADYLGLTYGAMNHRVQRNWSMERIVNTPMREW